VPGAWLKLSRWRADSSTVRSPRLTAFLALTLATTLALSGCVEQDATDGEQGASAKCHPSYEGACLDPSAYDYDCEGGTGDGPKYTGYVEVVGPDDFGLDRDGDGAACEL
jgi:hypothetical protein